MNGTELLADFRASRSESAFGELVRRYTNLVYSVAARRLGNVALAQEATQTVFIRLARAMPNLRRDAELMAWLHRTALHVSIDLWRSESRRRAREEQAASMHFDTDESASWHELSPVLDKALDELDDGSREAILLRFFQEKPMREIGAAFGISEAAAKMRITRALDRLRDRLVRQGVVCSSVGLGALLDERAVQAAPSAVAVFLGALSLPVAPGLAGAGNAGWVATLSKAKVAIGLAIALVGVAFLAFNREHRQTTPVPVPVNEAARPNPAPAEAQAARDANTFEQDGNPDPVRLLRAVALARQRISSGSVEFDLSSEYFIDGHRETNQWRLIAAFDGSKLRVDQRGMEYAYTALSGQGGEEQDARKKNEGMDRAAAVRAGLIKPFEKHYVTVYDGTKFLEYRESYGRGSTVVNDGSSLGGVYIFDPRCLGLRTTLATGSTIENCLGYEEAKSITLAGKDAVDGVPTWHIRIVNKYDETLDFWIESAQTRRVLKHAKGSGVAISKYDPRNPKNPLPIEVITSQTRNGSFLSQERFLQTKLQASIQIDPSSFTFAGLGMEVGCEVVDTRNSRTIGYWTGGGLSEYPPPKGTIQTGPDYMELLGTLEKEPTSGAALDAAAWILLNTPDGPDVEKAAEVVLREHIESPDLSYLAQELGRVRHRSAHELLEAMVEKNPNVEVKATAAFTLATILKDEAKFGEDKKATAKAEKLFERVIKDFSKGGRKEAEFARKAKPELYELRTLTIGKSAPSLDSQDLEGNTIRLDEHRGEVVVLIFWAGSYSESREHRKLIEKMRGRPFVLIGINCDEKLEKAESSVDKYQITWPTIWDGRYGQISEIWNVHSWVSTFVLDRKGVIRYRDLREWDIEKALEKLLGE
jgi:RNA polymerase sigma factor (sigma-70 family)